MRRKGIFVELDELAELEKTLKLDFPWWVYQLENHKKATARKEATIALGKLKEGHEKAFEALRTAMDQDSNFEVRAVARKALQSPIYLRWQDRQESKKSKTDQAHKTPITPPEAAYQNGMALLGTVSDKGDQKKAIAELVVAFRDGDVVIRQQALAELEKLGEVEVF